MIRSRSRPACPSLGPFAAVSSVLLSLSACSGTRDAAWDDTTPEPQAAVQVSAAEGQTALQSAESAWAQRDDMAQAQAAIDGFSRAAGADPHNPDLYVRLSRAQYFMADCHLRFDDTKREQMMTSFLEGTRAAEKALLSLSDEFKRRMDANPHLEDAIEVLDERAVPALYWRASNLGKWASADGFATLLSHKDEIRAMMSFCLEKDREFFHWGPDRYFGVFFGRAPAFAGGDLQRSKEHFEASLARVPNYFGTHVLMAQDYAVKAQERAVFDEHLTYVLNTDPAIGGDEIAPENRCEVRKARILQSQAAELFE